MSATKSKPIQSSGVRCDFDQIQWGSEEFQRFEKMADHELSTLASNHEFIANKARYALWRRHELKHQGN